MRYILKTLLLSLLLIVMSGCEKKYTYVTTEEGFKATTDKERALVESFKEYWEYFSAKEFEKAYPYEVAYERFLHDLTWYKKFNSANYKGYKLTIIALEKVEDDIYDVKSNYSYEGDGYTFLDRWYYVDGKWQHTMKTSLLPNIY